METGEQVSELEETEKKAPKNPLFREDIGLEKVFVEPEVAVVRR